MRAGRLDRRIDIERKSVSVSPFGDEVVTWTKLAANRAATVTPVRGNERFADEQFLARQQVTFTIRWSQGLASLNPLDRIVYPVFTPVGSPPEDPPAHQVYDVIEVSELGRRSGLRIVAARRAEAPEAA